MVPMRAASDPIVTPLKMSGDLEKSGISRSQTTVPASVPPLPAATRN